MGIQYLEYTKQSDMNNECIIERKEFEDSVSTATKVDFKITTPENSISESIHYCRSILDKLTIVITN